MLVARSLSYNVAALACKYITLKIVLGVILCITRTLHFYTAVGSTYQSLQS